MTDGSRVCRLLVGLAGSVLLAPESALAYGGPGSIITGLGALLATVAALVATIFGLLWFPLKRLVKTIRLDDEEEDPAGERE